MKLDVTIFRYLSRDDFRVLTAIEMGLKNHEFVPTQLIECISALKKGSTRKVLSNLLKHKLVAHDGKKYDGYKLTYNGYDFLALRAFINRGLLADVGMRMGVGKEADIHVAWAPDGRKLALKLHRLGRVSFKSIKNNRDYLQHRKHASWMYMARLAATKEYAYNKALAEAGFRVPEAVDHNRHAILMEYVNSTPLYNIRILKHPFQVLERLFRLAVRLAKSGLIHGDFNEFNLMIDTETEKVTLIDFPQIVTTEHLNAQFYFDRDVKCIVNFFRKRFSIECEEWPQFEPIMDEVREQQAKLDKESGKLEAEQAKEARKNRKKSKHHLSSDDEEEEAVVEADKKNESGDDANSDGDSEEESKPMKKVDIYKKKDKKKKNVEEEDVDADEETAGKGKGKKGKGKKGKGKKGKNSSGGDNEEEDGTMQFLRANDDMFMEAVNAERSETKSKVIDSDSDMSDEESEMEGNDDENRRFNLMGGAAGDEEDVDSEDEDAMESALNAALQKNMKLGSDDDSEEEEEDYLAEDNIEVVNNHMFMAGKRRNDAEQIAVPEGEEGSGPSRVTFEVQDSTKDINADNINVENGENDVHEDSESESDYSDKDNDVVGAVPTISDQIHVLKRKKTVQRKKFTPEDVRSQLRTKERNAKLRGSHKGRANRRAKDEANQAVKDFGY